MSATDQRPVPQVPGPGNAEDARDYAPDDPRAIEHLIVPVARRAVEIVRDMRPENSLTRLVTPEISQQLARRAALTRRLRATTGFAPARALMVTGVRICIVNEHTVEASCVLREPDRARFLAMRWELRHTGWRVTVLEIG
ncbi:Rv3235 family protein [Brachybacterium paraconglomeratum]|uniref:Rv3235 family protein n=1 Tax=Brachybacterium paraconglomeratum TaxID=173362 RepID=UPI0031E5AE76